MRHDHSDSKEFKRRACPNCKGPKIYSERHDAYCCPSCNIWLEPICSDPNCEFCKNRILGPGTAGQITTPVRPSDISDTPPEFVRIQDVQKLFGLKRGIVYRRIKDGTIKSVLLREPGNQQGVRLVYAQSIRDLLHGLMASQTVEGGGK